MVVLLMFYFYDFGFNFDKTQLLKNIIELLENFYYILKLPTYY